MLTSLAWMIAVLELLVSLVTTEPVYEVLHVQRMKWNLFSSYEVDRNIFQLSRSLEQATHRTFKDIENIKCFQS
jgi:hypothetical protein